MFVRSAPKHSYGLSVNDAVSIYSPKMSYCPITKNSTALSALVRDSQAGKEFVQQ